MNILITGASRGIGAVIARELYGGNTITHLGRSECTYADVEYMVDFTLLPDIEKSIKDIADKGKNAIPYQGVILNAGINDRAKTQWSIEAISLHCQINTLAPVYLIKWLRDYSLLDENCNIIVLGIYAGEMGHSQFVAYAMSKAALKAYVQSFAQLMGFYNMNLLYPGQVNTPGNPKEGRADKNKFKEPEELIPTIRWMLQNTAKMSGRIIDLGVK